jgi:hypothetical protein
MGILVFVSFSLKFANQVNQVQLGAAKKSVTIVQAPPPALLSHHGDGSSQSPSRVLRSQTAPGPTITHSPIKRRAHPAHGSMSQKGAHSHSHHSSSPSVAAHKPVASRRVVTTSHTMSSSSSLAKTKSKKTNGGWR